jgi:hypothetical protein
MKDLIERGWATPQQVMLESETEYHWELSIENVTGLDYCPKCGDRVRFLKDPKEDFGSSLVMVGLSSHRYIIKGAFDEKPVNVVAVRYMDDPDRAFLGYTTEGWSWFDEKLVDPYGFEFMGFNHVPLDFLGDFTHESDGLAEWYEENDIDHIGLSMYGSAMSGPMMEVGK